MPLKHERNISNYCNICTKKLVCIVFKIILTCVAKVVSIHRFLKIFVTNQCFLLYYAFTKED